MMYENCMVLNLLHANLPLFQLSLLRSEQVRTVSAAVLSLASWDFAQQPSSLEAVIMVLRHARHMVCLISH